MRSNHLKSGIQMVQSPLIAISFDTYQRVWKAYSQIMTAKILDERLDKLVHNVASKDLRTPDFRKEYISVIAPVTAKSAPE